MLTAATNQTPGAPSCEQQMPNVAPKAALALALAGAIFVLIGALGGLVASAPTPGATVS